MFFGVRHNQENFDHHEQACGRIKEEKSKKKKDRTPAQSNKRKNQSILKYVTKRPAVSDSASDLEVPDLVEVCHTLGAEDDAVRSHFPDDVVEDFFSLSIYLTNTC